MISVKGKPDTFKTIIKNNNIKMIFSAILHALFRIFLVCSGLYEVISRNAYLPRKKQRLEKQKILVVEKNLEEITVSGFPKFLLTPPQTTRD